MKRLQILPASQFSVRHQRGINWIMPIYFVTGMVGSVFLGILLLRDFGYITFEPYDYYATQYFLLMGLGLLMAYGWIGGLALILQYRSNWIVVTPAAILVAIKLLSIASKLLAYLGISAPFIAAAEYVAIHVYCIAALLLGAGWLIHKIVR